MCMAGVLWMKANTSGRALWSPAQAEDAAEGEAMTAWGGTGVAPAGGHEQAREEELDAERAREHRGAGAGAERGCSHALCGRSGSTVCR